MADTKVSTDASNPWFTNPQSISGLAPPTNATTTQSGLTNQQVGQLAIGITNQSGNLQAALNAIKTAILNRPNQT